MALKEVGVKLKVDGVSEFKSKMGDATGSIDGFGSALQKHSKTIRNIGLGMTAAAAGIGIASLKMSADFDSAMREVNTLIGLSQEEFESLSDQVLQSAKDVGKAPEEMARALYQVVSAGIPAGEALQFLNTSAKAAIGGVTDTTTAVDGITTVINAFGLSASDAESVASTMFETVKRGKTTFDELSSYMFQVANTAASLDIEFATVSAALATMTKAGIPTAQATTQLRQAMVALTKPTEDMKKALKKLGYESGKALIKEKGLQKGLALLRKETQGNDEQLGKMFGSVEALNAVLSLTGDNAETFTEDLEAISAAAEEGTASTEAYNEMNKSAARQFEDLMTTVKVLAIEIGGALMPALVAIVDAIRPILEVVAEWISNNPELTAAIIAVVGVVGTFLTALGFLLPAITAITGAIGVAGGAAGLIGALGAIAAPVAIVIAAIAALIAITVLIVKYWDEIVDFFKWVWDKIVDFFKAAWDWFMDWGAYFFGIPGIVIKHWDVISGFFKDMWDKVVAIFKAVWDWLLDWGLYFLGIPGVIIKHWDVIYGFFKRVWDTVYEVFQSFRNQVQKWVIDRIVWWVDVIKSAWDTIYGFFQKVWDAVYEIFRAFRNNAQKWIIDKIIGWVEQIKSVWRGVTGFFQGIWDNIYNIGKTMINSVIALINKAIGLVSGKTIIKMKKVVVAGVTVFPGVTVRLPTIPKIPTLGGGGTISKGGLALVGERGPELLSLPAGATVQPLTNNYEYNITENYARPESPQSLDLTLQALAMLART